MNRSVSKAFVAITFCFLISPAFGETKLDHLRNQYVECTRRAYLAEVAGPQFNANRNADTAAERVLSACRTEEDAWWSVFGLFNDRFLYELFRTQALEFKLQLKNNLVRSFTNLNVKAAQNTPPASKPSNAPVGKQQITAAARQPDTPETAALNKLIQDTKSPKNDPVWRASLATALHQYCESILKQVPPNTPEQDRWVDSEVNESFQKLGDPQLEETERQLDRFDRFERAMNSAEYARKNLRSLFSWCSEQAKDLSESKQASPGKEALLWVNLAKIFFAEEYFWPWADRIGLMSEAGCRGQRAAKVSDILQDRFDARDRNNLCHWDNIGFSVLNDAVIPLLEQSR
jgi:hypothetical protein